MIGQTGPVENTGQGAVSLVKGLPEMTGGGGEVGNGQSSRFLY
jgi:hypothetical protein